MLVYHLLRTEKESCSEYEEEDGVRGVLIRYRWSHAMSDLGPIRVKLITL